MDDIATFTVPALNLSTLTKRLDKLSRKANKYGTAPIGYSIGDRVIKETTIYVDNKPRKIETEFANVVVWGDAPKYGNHTFLARVELLDGENIVNNIAGVTLDARFRMMVSECDHCGHKRNRNDVYVFADENGKQIAVGRTCLRDFTGCDNPLEIVNRATFLSDIKTACDEESFSFSSGGFGYVISDVLEYAAANIRAHGWISKAMAMNSYDDNTMTTADRVFMDLNPTAKRKPIEVTETDIDLANKTKEYFQKLDMQSDNDYINNLRVICKMGNIQFNKVAILVSAINVIIRNKQDAIKKQSAPVSEYVGNVKERMKGIELTFNREISLGAGLYGEQYLYSFTDNNNNQLNWFTTKREFNIGETYSMDLTIKGHKEYRGIKQTIITRASVK